MPEFTINYDFEAYCEKCGTGMCANVTTTKTGSRGYPCISINPCSYCLDKRYDEGKEDGYDEGRADGLKEGAQE